MIFASVIGRDIVAEQATRDHIITLWVNHHRLDRVLRHLKESVAEPYTMLYDLTAIDERNASIEMDSLICDFTVVYHLMSLDGNRDIRLKVPVSATSLKVPSVCHLFKNANWYEREVFDMFGIEFAGHPCLRRILMPQSWQGHPLAQRASSARHRHGPISDYRGNKKKQNKMFCNSSPKIGA